MPMDESMAALPFTHLTLRGQPALGGGVIIAGTLLLLLVVYWLRRDKRLDKLPGPKGNLLTGNGLELPPDSNPKFKEWGHRYGEIFKLRIGWWNYVVLNSPEAVKEIMDRQATATSSKIPSPMSSLVVAGRRMPFMPYGPKWKRYRTLCQNLLMPKMDEHFVPAQTQEIAQLLNDLASTTNDQSAFRAHIHRALFSVILKVVYGRRIDTDDDEDVKYTMASSQVLAKWAKYIEDIFPPLAKLPAWMQPSIRQAKRDAELLIFVKMRMWKRMTQHLAADRNKAPFCFAATMINQPYKEQGLEEEDLAWIAGGLVDAGSHTSTHTMVNTMLYLAANPEAQARARDEVDKVVGRSRLPAIADNANLPYVAACVKEVLRLCPVPPISATHFSDADVAYKDVVIPKGTAIVCNTMFLNYDPSRYPDPESFRPERYMAGEKSPYTLGPNERDHYTFGTGRRICPGTRLSEGVLTFMLASILWAFEVRPAQVLVDGQLRDEKLDVSDAAFEMYPVRRAKPFKARFIPRGEDRVEMVRRNYEALAEK